MVVTTPRTSTFTGPLIAVSRWKLRVVRVVSGQSPSRRSSSQWNCGQRLMIAYLRLRAAESLTPVMRAGERSMKSMQRTPSSSWMTALVPAALGNYVIRVNPSEPVTLIRTTH